MTLFFAFGVAFEVPIATIILVWMGVVSPESLRQKRPYVVVGAFVVGMFLTPPDVISQTLLAIPMWLLYEAGIFFSRFFLRRGTNAEADAATSPATQTAVAGGGGFSPPGEGLGAAAPGDPLAASEVKSGGETVVGREISGGDPHDTDRFRPMTEEEMEAELDAIEAQELDVDSGAPDSGVDPVEAKLEQVMELREDEDEAGARKLLYEILAEGDEEQRQVARNILEQLDT
jgi:sec-independent protein translocase protein TatC